jgi:hypothetical protein
MTQRHFEKIAEALASTRPAKGAAGMITWTRTVEAIARVCETENPRFDAARFGKATREEATS